MDSCTDYGECALCGRINVCSIIFTFSRARARFPLSGPTQKSVSSYCRKGAHVSRGEIMMIFIMEHILLCIIMIILAYQYTLKYRNMVMDLWSMLYRKSPYPQILILAPSKNSAKEIAEYLRCLGRSVALLIHDKQIKWPKSQSITARIIVGTPGISLDYAEKYKCFDFSAIKMVTVDDVNNLIKVQGYHDGTIRIARKLPDGCNMNLYSANIQVNEQKFADRLQRCNTQVTFRPGRFLDNVNHSALDRYGV